jgi:multiple sugar transport system permease protein
VSFAQNLRQRFHRHGYDNLAGWAMIAPALILLTIFMLVPFVMAFVLSFEQVSVGTDRPAIWVGFQQYERIFTDDVIAPVFYRSLLNNFIFALIVVPIQTLSALLLAIWLNQKLRGIAFFRAFFFLPVVFPMALVAVVWSLIYSRGTAGLLNSFVSWASFGLIPAQDWLGNPATALASIAFMSMWAGVGFQMIILLAGLQEIPQELYEAAAIDKASKWQQFINVTFPGLKNTLIFVVIVTTIFSLRLFDQVYIMTNGGPDNSTSTVMFQAVTTAFQAGNVGRGAAMTVVFVIIIGIITVIQRRVLRQDKEIS